MQSTHRTVWRAWLVGGLMALGLGIAQAQSLKVDPVEPAPQQAAPQQQGGIKSANIFEIAPDASKDPNYANQTNAERGKVQPGNNAPMWRCVDPAICAIPRIVTDQCR